VVKQSPFASVPVLNTNSRALQRWSQQASPAASTASAARLVPSFATHQACAAGPNKSGLPHTPAARCLSARRSRRKAAQYKRPRCVGGSRNQGQSRAGSRFFLPSFKVGCRSSFRSLPFASLARLLRSNARQAEPAELHWPAVGRRALVRPRANPSVKGTSTSGLRPLVTAPYLER
jgi:hypothetical protein